MRAPALPGIARAVQTPIPLLLFIASVSIPLPLSSPLSTPKQQLHHHAAVPPPWWVADRGCESRKMGQGLSCRELEDTELFSAVQNGEVDAVEALAAEDPNLLRLRTVHGRLSALHVAAANGRAEVRRAPSPSLYLSLCCHAFVILV